MADYSEAEKQLQKNNESMLRQALIDGFSSNPDKAASALPYAEKYGMPLDMAERKIDDLKKIEHENSINYGLIAQSNPQLAKWLREEDNARISHDDVNALVDTADYIRELGAGAASDALGGYEGYGKLVQSGVNRLGDRLQLTDNPLTNFLAATGLGIVSTAGLGMEMFGKGYDFIGKQISIPDERKSFGTNIARGLGQVGVQVPLSIVSPTAAAVMNYGMGAKQAYDYADSKGITDQDTRDALALSYGMATFVTETLGTKALKYGIPKGFADGAMKNIIAQASANGFSDASIKVALKFADTAFRAGAEGTQEFSEGFLQNMANRYIAGDQTPLMDTLGSQAAVGAGVGGIVGAIANIFTKGRIDFHLANEKEKRDQRKQNDTAIIEKIKALKLAGRSPEKLKQLVSEITPNGTVTFDSGVVGQFYQSGLDPEEFLQLVPSVRGQFENSDVTLEDIEIKYDEYLNLMAQHGDKYGFIQDYQKVNTELSPHLQDLMSRTDLNVDEVNSLISGLVDEYSAEFQKTMERDDAGQPSFDIQLERKIESMLTDQKIMGEKVRNAENAAAEAKLFGEYIRRTLSGAGEKATMDVLQRRLGGDNFSIKGPMLQQADPKRSGSAYVDYLKKKQLAKDRILARENEARKSGTLDMFQKEQKKKREVTPTPLISALIKMGGIERGTKIAEELAHIGVDPKKYPRLFRAKPKYVTQTSKAPLRGLDNIPLQEFEQLTGFYGAFLNEASQNGYVSEKDLLEKLRDETFGNYLKTDEQLAAEQADEYESQIMDALDRQGVDIRTATEQEIDAALQREKDAYLADADMYQNGRANTDSEAFKKWFGDSKVVDADGKPIVAYHGGEKGIQAFDPSKIGERYGLDKDGFFFTSDGESEMPGSAKSYAGDTGQVYPVYLKIEKPYTLEQYAKDTGTTVDNLIYYGEDIQSPISVYDEARDDITARMKEGGYDGLIFEYTQDDGYHEAMYMATKPEQIKSVNNRGTFDPNDARILYQSSADMYQNGVAKTESEAFKKWFGDSKVVDSDGKPLVVYHGTNADFEKFDSSFKKSREGFWFGNSELASKFSQSSRDGGEVTGSNVMPVYLKIENPLIHDPKEHFGMTIDEIINEARKNGNDGIQFTSQKDGEKTFMAFEPTQIKSVYNRGTWDGEDSRILFQSSMDDNKLVAMHNISEKGLMNANKIGGLPVPSLAITRADIPFDSFGEISLIAPSSLIDPKTNKSAKVFDADVYSPRYPRAIHETDPKVFNAFVKEINILTGGKKLRSIERLHEDVSDRGIDGALINSSVKLAYLQYKGIAPDAIFEKKKKTIIDDNPDLKKFVGKDYFDLPKDADFIEGIKKAVDKVISLNPDLERVYYQDGKLNDNILRSYARDVSAYSEDVKIDDYEFEKAIRDVQVDDADFNKWVENKFFGVVKAEKIFDGFTNSGNRRYLPHNLDTVVKIMKRSLKDGEGFNYGVPSIRASLAKKFTSLKSIKDDSNRLITSEDMEKVKEEIGADFDALWEKFAGKLKYDHNFGDLDRFSEVLKEYGRTKKKSEFDYQFKDLTDADYKAADEFLDKLKNLPTQYFEVKMQRAVNLNEFAGAVVSDRVGKEALDTLTKNGIKYTVYKHGDAADRARAVQDMTQGMQGSGMNVLFQSGQQHQAYIQFNQMQTIIRLLEGANFTSLLHEFGHLFLELDAEIAAHPDVNPEFAKQHAAQKEWLGQLDPKDAIAEIEKMATDFEKKASKEKDADTKAELSGKAENIREALKYASDSGGEQVMRDTIANMGNNLPEKYRIILLTPYHERFARGFEVYLYTGEAPSLELKSVFVRFKNWFVAVYKSIRQFGFAKISPEMKDVFDRLLATDEQIELVKQDALFHDSASTKAALDALPKNVMEKYLKARDDAFEAAKMDAARKALRQAQRKNTAFWKEEVAKFRKQAEDNMKTERVYKALNFLKTGQDFDGNPLLLAPAENYKLNDDAVIRILGAYGKEELKYLPRGSHSKDGTADPALVADLFGYDSAIQMLSDLRNRNTFEREAAKRAEDTAIIVHGDMLNDGTIEKEAMQFAIKEEVAAQHLLLKALQDLTNSTNKLLMGEKDFKAAAQVALSRLTVEQATKPERYYKAALKASYEYGKAMGKKDYDAAVKAKQREILNKYMYSYAKKAQEQTDKALDHFYKLSKRPKLRDAKAVKIDPEYHQKIWDILGMYDIGPRLSDRARTKMELQAIAAWMKQKEEDDNAALLMPQRILDADSKTHYRDLTLEEFRALNDLVLNIEKQGRMKREFLFENEKRDLQEMASDLRSEAESNLPDMEYVDQNTMFGGIKKKALYLDAVNTKISAYMVKLDGGNIMGKWTRAIYAPIHQAAVTRGTRTRAEYKKFHEIMDRHYSGEPLGFMNKQVGDYGSGNFRITHERMLMIAMYYTGTVNTRTKLLDGYKKKFAWDEAYIKRILSNMRENDWNFVMDARDYLDGFWSETSAVEERRFGYAPIKQDPLPNQEFETVDGKTVTVRGGYMRIYYDPELSERASDRQSKETFEDIKRFKGMQSSTKNGSMIEQVDGVEDPILLNIDNIPRHIQETITYITMAEPVDNVRRILNTGDVKKVLHNTIGGEGRLMIDLWVDDAVAGGVIAGDALNRVAATLRRNYSLGRLGFRPLTAIIQTTGIVTALGDPDIRGHVMGGFATYISNPLQTHEEVFNKSEYMRERKFEFNRDVSDALNFYKRKGKYVSEKVAMAGLWGIQQVQMQVDMVVWLSAYQKAQKENMPEEDAIQYADMAVDRTAGGGNVTNLSAIERGTTGAMNRGSELWKASIPFISYFNAKYNIIKNANTKFNAKQITAFDLALTYIMTLLLEGLLSAFLMGQLHLDKDDDDEISAKEVGLGAFNIALGQYAGGIPLVRDFYSGLEGYDRGGSALTLVTQGGKSIANIGNQILEGDDVNGYRAARDVVKVANMIVPLPASAINQFLRGLEDEDADFFDYFIYKK